jgi:serine/threonine kinase 32
MDFIHSQGYVYRDIKASNILMSEEGRIHIVDYDLACKIDKTGV